MESLSHNKRVRSNSDDSEFHSPEAKRIQRDLLDALEDSDEFAANQHLDSFIKSFEDEISPPPETLDRTSDSGESRPDLEFLLEASDDELGLPPTETAVSESERIPVPTTESVELGVFSWLDDQISDYGSLEYEFDYADGDVNGDVNGEYVALDDGLFDYADLGFGTSELTRLPESLPAQ